MLSRFVRIRPKALATFARRNLYRLIYAVAIAGVPLGVVYGTGGLDTIGFWATAVLWLPMSVIGLMPFAFLVIIPLAPVLWIADKLSQGWVNQNIDRLMPPLWGALALVVYVLGADLRHTGDVWLPTPWPNLGALVVMAVASATFAGLFWLGSVLETPGQQAPYVGRWGDVPEPDHEFWSDQLVEGWRTWKWENGRLHGVMAVWESAEFKAKCQHCSHVPDWDHACGVYAVKSLRDAHRFHQGSEVVGKVEMWGRVIEHEHGYRVQHARITDLWTSSEELATDVEKKYPVRVHVGIPELESEELPWRT